MFQQQGMDAILRGVMVAGLLGHFDELGVAARQGQYVLADQAVVQNHIGFVKQAQGAQGQQAGIARAGADQRDGALGGYILLLAQGREKHLFGLDELMLPKHGKDRPLQQRLEPPAPLRQAQATACG